MIKINPYHVLNLTPKSDAPCLSLYASTERELAQLIERAEELGLKTYDPATVDRLLKPMHTVFKNFTANGLTYPIALFSTKGFSGYARLPFETRPLSVVASSFHVKPLLKWMQREHPYSLLCLKGKEAILYQGSLSYFEEIERLDYRELKTMDGMFNALDRAVYRSIQSSRVPLILAGEIDLIEIYRSVSGYKGIVDDSIIDPNVFEDLERLHGESLQILEPFLEQKEAGHINSYLSAERGGRTSSVLQEIIQLALVRKIKHLFVNEKMNVWGKINYETGSFTYSPKQTDTEDDVLDDLAEIVMKNHGLVTVLPPNKMPGGKAACAILTGATYSLRLSRGDYTSPREAWVENAVS